MSPASSSVFIGLGSNIDPEKNLRAAATQLKAQFPNIRFSSVFSSAPLERIDQPTFLNAVARIETDQSPTALKSILESIEFSLKKSPPFRFGPRTIDLDILLYGNLVLPDAKTWMTKKRSAISRERRTSPEAGDQRSEILTIPHLKMDKRRFVLEPLLELIDPATIHPVSGKPLAAFLQSTLDQTCTRTAIVL